MKVSLKNSYLIETLVYIQALVITYIGYLMGRILISLVVSLLIALYIYDKYLSERPFKSEEERNFVNRNRVAVGVFSGIFISTINPKLQANEALASSSLGGYISEYGVSLSVVALAIFSIVMYLKEK